MPSRSNIANALITGSRFGPGNRVQRRLVKVPDAATYTVIADDTGRIHILPNFTSTCAITLPAVAPDLEFEFWHNLAAADAQNWSLTALAGAFYKGGVVFMDQDGDVMAPVYANGSSHLILTVVTPEVGTKVMVVCDGTFWFLNGNIFSATTPTIT